MSASQNDFAFDQFPRAKLAFPVSRRQFLSALNTDYLAWSKKANGGAVFTLADLGILPDEDLARIIPEVSPGCQISIQEGTIYAKPAAQPKPRQLFPLDCPALTVFNLFNGQTSLAEASRHLAEHTGWEEGKCFAYTRGVFLSLVQAGVCLPKGF